MCEKCLCRVHYIDPKPLQIAHLHCYAYIRVILCNKLTEHQPWIPSFDGDLWRKYVSDNRGFARCCRSWFEVISIEGNERNNIQNIGNATNSNVRNGHRYLKWRPWTPVEHLFVSQDSAEINVTRHIDKCYLPPGFVYRLRLPNVSYWCHRKVIVVKCLRSFHKKMNMHAKIKQNKWKIMKCIFRKQIVLTQYCYLHKNTKVSFFL